MIPVIASGTHLPFGDEAFEAVIASDVLEHVPPELRQTVITEALRVARKLVIFGFPSGTDAHNSDRKLRHSYLSNSLECPVWLEEHMLAPFPDESLFVSLSGWEITQFGNESIGFHSWMLRQEFHRSFVRASNLVRRLAPWLLRLLLRQADRPPFYRKIFVLSRAG